MGANSTNDPRLTIGMACFDDFDGVWFTVKSLGLYHPNLQDRAEILVVDNNPASKHGREVKRFVESTPGARYVEFGVNGGTAQPRNEIFHQARGTFVLCLDAHVLVEPGALSRLLDFYEVNPHCRDLLQGPLIGDKGNVIGTHQEPRWRRQAHGCWAVDDRGVDPSGTAFEIPQQGMGCFSCRRDAWPGFHRDFRGFGGCESYVAERFRRAGGQVMCLPFLRWHHRFPRPNGVPYPVDAADRLRNYLIAAAELGWDREAVIQGYCHDLEPQTAAKLLGRIGEPAGQEVDGNGVDGKLIDNKEVDGGTCRHLQLHTSIEFHRLEVGGELAELVGAFSFHCSECGKRFDIAGNPSGKFVVEPRPDRER